MTWLEAILVVGGVQALTFYSVWWANRQSKIESAKLAQQQEYVHNYIAKYRKTK
jgi:hypothetical protein